MNKKLFGYLGVGLLVLNLILYALGAISGLLFWLVVAVMALVGYVALPRMK